MLIFFRDDRLTITTYEHLNKLQDSRSRQAVNDLLHLCSSPSHQSLPPRVFIIYIPLTFCIAPPMIHNLAPQLPWFLDACIVAGGKIRRLHESIFSTKRRRRPPRGRNKDREEEECIHGVLSTTSTVFFTCSMTCRLDCSAAISRKSVNKRRPPGSLPVKVRKYEIFGN